MAAPEFDPNVFVEDFAAAIKAADALLPVATSHNGKRQYLPGIGPHSERNTLALIAAQLRKTKSSLYASLGGEIAYPSGRGICDWSLGFINAACFIEAKMVRLFGDNGRPNDNILTHILSPYHQHRSAVTDCAKLRTSGFHGRLFILIYGYEYQGYPLELTASAFELLARQGGALGPRAEAKYGDLVHPVHAAGAVYLWELL